MNVNSVFRTLTFINFILLYNVCMAIAPSENQSKIYSKHDSQWFPFLYSNYIIEGTVKDIEDNIGEIKVTLTDSQFLKGHDLSRVINVTLDVKSWEKKSIANFLNKLNNLSLGERVLVFSTHHYKGSYLLYPYDVIKEGGLEANHNIIKFINSAYSMSVDSRLMINPIPAETIVSFRKTEEKVFNDKLFQSGVRELISKGKAYSLLIYSEIANSIAFEKKFIKKIKDTDFYRKYQPKNTTELYDSVMYEIFGFKPYYPIGHKLHKEAMIISGWRTYIWLTFHPNKIK